MTPIILNTWDPVEGIEVNLPLKALSHHKNKVQLKSNPLIGATKTPTIEETQALLQKKLREVLVKIENETIITIPTSLCKETKAKPLTKCIKNTVEQMGLSLVEILVEINEGKSFFQILVTPNDKSI